MAQRDRGQYLTEEGLARLEEAILAWADLNGRKCTQEKLKELSGGLDQKTIANIRNRKAGSDVASLQRLFFGLGLILAETDHYIPIPAKSEVKFDRNFVGRDQAIDDLNYLVGQNSRIIVIQAKGGVGKTTLAQQYFKTQGFDKVLELWMAKETQNIASVESVVEEWLRQDFDEEPGREFSVSLERLRKRLRDPALRIGILIDNLEPALDTEGKFVSEHRHYIELLRVLGDGEAQSLTLITSRERLRESAVSVHPYLLSNLSCDGWLLRFQSRQVEIDEDALTQIHRAYGGNAKAMEILGSAVLQDYQGKLIAYWNDNQNDLLLERDLEDLVLGQVDRLQEHDLAAYTLLCRMGCYRYSDIPSVPMDGIVCLLWDVKEKDRPKAVYQLRDRSLVEYNQGRYWLHPVIKQVARMRLREDVSIWKKSNQIAAEFWRNSVQEIKTINDAMSALEAGSVILQKRSIKSIPAESLGASFYRLGLLRQIQSKIDRIICFVEKKETLAALNNIMGDLFWMMGDASKGIECHSESGRISKIMISDSMVSPSVLREMIRFYVVHYFNIALCKIEFREMDVALDFVEKSYRASLRFNAERTNILDCYYMLAYLNAVLNRREESWNFIDLYNKEAKINFSYSNSWEVVYGPVFMGFAYAELECFDKAAEMYEKAISCSRFFNYPQAESKALNGLAEIERINGEFFAARSRNLQVIECCLRIGAKYDLAEAYFQLGLTCRCMDEVGESNVNFQKSIDLFSELNAPIQVERVSQAMLSQETT
jgi:tetratricopeptide (TPR) repeat protein